MIRAAFSAISARLRYDLYVILQIQSIADLRTENRSGVFVAIGHRSESGTRLASKADVPFQSAIYVVSTYRLMQRAFVKEK